MFFCRLDIVRIAFFFLFVGCAETPAAFPLQTGTDGDISIDPGSDKDTLLVVDTEIDSASNVDTEEISDTTHQPTPDTETASSTLPDDDTHTGADTDTDSDTDTDTDSDTDTDTDTDTDSDIDADTDSDADADTDTEEDTGPSTDTQTTPDTDMPADSDSAPDTETGPTIRVKNGCDEAYLATSELTIDGELIEPAWHLATPIQTVVFGRLDDTILFDVVWDKENLYVGVTTDDRIIRSDSPDPRNDDALELAIDGNHDASGVMDSHDSHCIFRLLSNNMIECRFDNNYALHTGPIRYASKRLLSGLVTMEIAIPWEFIDITPASWTTIGFDIGVDDDDWLLGNLGRDNLIRWYSATDLWWDTSVFADIILLEETAETADTTPDRPGPPTMGCPE
jgi:hypothetical protein